MAKTVKNRADFMENFAVHAALRHALKQKFFAKDAQLKRTTERLVNELEGDRTTFGRQLNMLKLMSKGATVPEMQKKLRCSRRTVFRYLNYLEEAGVVVELVGQQYKTESSTFK